MFKYNQAYIWKDAKDFDDLGGWRLDTQFISNMGSAYLLATGIGAPVKDAFVNVEILKEGSYRLWVRCKNWLMEYSPGKFHIEIGDLFSTKVLGEQQNEDWCWIDAGIFQLNTGNLKLTLKDETGYYGRFASLILTDDMDFLPSNDMEEMRLAKQQITGISTEPEVAGSWDVVVVGAGIAGCCAAIAAARQGAKTLLLDERTAFGGNALLGVPVNGAALVNANARESGIVEELARMKAYYNISNSEALKRMLEAEPNLQCQLGKVVVGVVKDEDKITSIKARDINTDKQLLYNGKIFIDCSGDGWVGYYAGAQMRKGREARDEFQEDFAPVKADGNLMSGVVFGEAFLFRSADTGAPAPYTPPSWAYQFNSEKEYGRPVATFVYGDWFHEHHGDIDEFSEPEKGRDELIRIVLGYWDYIKNVWHGKEKAINYALKTVAITLAKRESNRIMGDYILTQGDVENARAFEDSITYGGWPIDLHNHEGIFGKGGPYESSKCIPVYPIPYRCIYSKNINNLMCAGRNISMTHVALGTVRVQGTLGTIGEAAGTAAALCTQKNILPRKLGQEHIKELQQLLIKNDLYIPNLLNDDQADLAKKATISASSTNACKEFDKLDVVQSGFEMLQQPRAMMFPRGLYEKLENIYLSVSCKIPETQYEIELQIKCSDTPELTHLTDIKTIKKTFTFGEVFPFPNGENQYNQSEFGNNQWVEFDIRESIDKPYIWIFLPQIDNLYYGLMNVNAEQKFASYKQNNAGEWEKIEGQCHAFYTEPPLTTAGEETIKENYKPENIVNGMTRIVGQQSNMWASDAREALPQWIELAYSAPVAINKVYITFDTDLHKFAETYTDKEPFKCVSDYELSYFDGQEWKTLIKVESNFVRRRVHRFEEVLAHKLRLTILKTHGDKAARVFEIRIYKE